MKHLVHEPIQLSGGWRGNPLYLPGVLPGYYKRTMEVMEVLDLCKMEGDGTASCLYVLSGQGILRSKTQICDIARNDQFFIPACSGAYSISATEGMPVYLIMIKGPRQNRITIFF